MIDQPLVEKKLALIETYVRELESLARPEAVADDVREARFIEYTLQIAIQAALDIASHIVSEERLGEPETNADLFTALAKDGWIAKDLLPKLRQMAGFRNILVHGYAEVDVEIVRHAAESDVHDLTAFVAAVRGRLGRPGG